MPIPDTPYTRKEAYLNAAATGDSSGIPETPYTREEMYLDAIARNGGGGGGGSSVLVVNLSYDENTDTYTMDKTAAEIIAAFPTVDVFMDWVEDGEFDHYIVKEAKCMSGHYYVVISMEGGTSFYAASLNDYPRHSGGGSY